MDKYNKYTNPRKAERTPPEYFTVVQDLKRYDTKFLRSDYKTISIKALTTKSKNHIQHKMHHINHQLNTAVGLKDTWQRYTRR